MASLAALPIAARCRFKIYALNKLCHHTLTCVLNPGGALGSQLGYRFAHILRRMLPIAMFLLQKEGQFLAGHDLFLKRIGAAYHEFLEEVEVHPLLPLPPFIFHSSVNPPTHPLGQECSCLTRCDFKGVRLIIGTLYNLHISVSEIDRRDPVCGIDLLTGVQGQCRGKCLEDLQSTTRYVTWSLHTKSRSSLKQMLSKVIIRPSSRNQTSPNCKGSISREPLHIQ